MRPGVGEEEFDEVEPCGIEEETLPLKRHTQEATKLPQMDRLASPLDEDRGLDLLAYRVRRPSPGETVLVE